MAGMGSLGDGRHFGPLEGVFMMFGYGNMNFNKFFQSVEIVFFVGIPGAERRGSPVLFMVQPLYRGCTRGVRVRAGLIYGWQGPLSCVR